MKKILLNSGIVLLIIASIICIFIGRKLDKANQAAIQDPTKLTDVNTITLADSKVKVSFSDVILSNHNETRKLIVSEQTATVSYEISSQLIDKIDFDFLKKSQSVSYTGTGYFVVDLDKLTENDIIDDEENKTLTIRINHSYLEAITINPNDIKIGKTQNGLLAQGKLKLTVSDYNEIEKNLKSLLEKEFNTAKNGQAADEIALTAVKEIYEPIVHAVNKDYNVLVEFK